jgi:hypothetical protein
MRAFQRKTLTAIKFTAFNKAIRTPYIRTECKL